MVVSRGPQDVPTRVPLLALAIAIGAGCGSVESNNAVDAGTTPTEVSSAYQSYVGELAAAVCENIRRCEDRSFGTVLTTATQEFCVNHLSPPWQMHARIIERRLARDIVAFDADLAARCLAALGQRCFQRVEDVVEDACLDALVGRRAAGQSCERTDECVDSLACDGTGNACGVCTPQHGKRLGEACTDPGECSSRDTCADGVCTRPAIARLTRPVDTRASGESCESSGSMCAKGTWCSPARTCMPSRNDGEPCFEDRECPAGSTCAESTCRRPDYGAALDEECGRDGRWCAADGSSVCAKSEAASRSLCHQPHQAEGGTCGGLGSDHWYGDTCGASLVCVAGRCVRFAGEGDLCRKLDNRETCAYPFVCRRVAGTDEHRCQAFEYCGD